MHIKIILLNLQSEICFAKQKRERPTQLECTAHRRIIWGVSPVIIPVLIYSVHLLFPLFCFLRKVLCSAEFQCNEAGLVLFSVVSVLHPIFFIYVKLLF